MTSSGECGEGSLAGKQRLVVAISLASQGVSILQTDME